MRLVFRARFAVAAAGILTVLLLTGGKVGVLPATAEGAQAHAHRVTVPEADRFTPFALTIHSGDIVQWVNHDEDDHTVVSDDALNTARPRNIDHLLPVDGTYSIRFRDRGTFVYYCRFHAQLDEFNQPIAPGPDGGIQDENGNYGTPMMGVITVLP